MRTRSIEIDGLKLDLKSGNAAEGDSFVLKPYASAAGDMATVLRSARGLAAGSPVEARVGTGNTGGMAVGSLAATSANANLDRHMTF